MNRKKWIITWFILTAMIPLAGIFNYLVDPYGLNNFIIINKINSKKNSKTTLTTRFKSKMLNNGNYNTIMLGSSKIGVMNPEIIDKYLGAKTFNLAYPGSVAEMQNKLFFYALKSNDIKNVIYGIDFLSFNESRVVKNDFQEFYDLQNKIENKEKILNFDLYLNLETFGKSITLLVENILETKELEPIYLSNGMRDHINYIEDLENKMYDFDKEVNREIKHYYGTGGIYKEYNFSYEYLKYFREIITFCRKNNIKVWVYIPPMHSDLFNALEPAGYFDKFELFKRELLKITDFIDFTGNNTINMDKNNYWDGAHLRQELTEVLMSKIFDDRSVKAPKDFGVLVTKDNIEEHLSNLREQIDSYDLNKTIYK
ncbi:MAG: hypothetical protein COB07_11715 [Sulfurovum sp.]|nr:MAG: hypothetical protein COB07_11715 [Sulfurovum sp.]